MSKRLAFGLLAMMVLVSFMIGCEGKQGPAGPAGKDGMAGALEGYKDGIVCATCHSEDSDTTLYVAARAYQWELSKHAAGGAVFEASRNGCSACHSTQGFIKRVMGLPNLTNTDAAMTPPGCFACHSPHARGNFTLRTTAAQTVLSTVTGVADASFDYGKGNLCVQCHRSRGEGAESKMSPKMSLSTATTDTLKVTSSRWYNHYGVQGQMIMGVGKGGGAEDPAYGYENSYHTTSTVIKTEGCVICHMAGGNPAGGGHTMNIRYEEDAAAIMTGCNTSGCHTSKTMTDLDNWQHDVSDSLMILGYRLYNLGQVTFSVSAEGDTSWSVNAASTPANKVLRFAPPVTAAPLHNFFFIEHDKSKGIHNTKYAKSLIRAALKSLP